VLEANVDRFGRSVAGVLDKFVETEVFQGDIAIERVVLNGVSLEMIDRSAAVTRCGVRRTRFLAKARPPTRSQIRKVLAAAGGQFTEVLVLTKLCANAWHVFLVVTRSK